LTFQRVRRFLSIMGLDIGNHPELTPPLFSLHMRVFLIHHLPRFRVCRCSESRSGTYSTSFMHLILRRATLHSRPGAAQGSSRPAPADQGSSRPGGPMGSHPSFRDFSIYPSPSMFELCREDVASIAVIVNAPQYMLVRGLKTKVTGRLVMKGV
jgi:hypothetical protein